MIHIQPWETFFGGKVIVIAADDEDPDPGIIQPLDLAREEAGRLHRGLFAVIEVAG